MIATIENHAGTGEYSSEYVNEAGQKISYEAALKRYPAWILDNPLCYTMEDAAKLWERAWDKFWERYGVKQDQRKARHAYESKMKHEIKTRVKR